MYTEKEIVQLISRRDQKGLRIFYDQYARAMMGIVGRIIPDRSLAEDVLQQCLLKIWDKIDSYDSSKSGLFTWASVIARNTAIDKTRQANYKRAKENSNLEPIREKIGSVEDSSASIDTTQLLSGLDEKYSLILQKVYLEGYSQGAIAKELGIPLGTVKTRVRTAILQLRKELKNEKGLFIAGISLLAYIILNLMS